MPAGSGLGAAREAMMVDGIMKWARENRHMRPTEVGGVDILATLAHLHKAVCDGEIEDQQVRMAHRYLCFFVQELAEILHD